MSEISALQIEVSSAALLARLELYKQEGFDFLVDLTAVDYPQRESRFEAIYRLRRLTDNAEVVVKVASSGEAPLPSATGLFSGANWLERELYDMFGLTFAGHPDMKRILLPDGWVGHPLRREYGLTQMDNAWVQANLGIESGQ
ncbi:MAG: NADH-quinone oxidoreductase subunit C [Acidobacteria bacterium]|nr:NADH-quinone oxidoreductase subunit C [Acidobacteriota bacterium]